MPLVVVSLAVNMAVAEALVTSGFDLVGNTEHQVADSRSTTLQA
jgi:hypothetical protein